VASEQTVPGDDKTFTRLSTDTATVEIMYITVIKPTTYSGCNEYKSNDGLGTQAC